MVFGLFKKKPLLELLPGEELEIEVDKEEGKKYLYATVKKVSKKKNVFVQFLPQNRKEAIIDIGTSVKITVFKKDCLYSFSSNLLHWKEDTDDFIFAPPLKLETKKLPTDPFLMTLNLETPVEYRAISSAHVQRGITREIKKGRVSIITNVLIPSATLVNLEFQLPHKPAIRARGKVVESERLLEDIKKYNTWIEFEELDANDEKLLFDYAVYQLRWKECRLDN